MAGAALEQFSRANREALEGVVRESFVHALGDAYRVGALVALGGLLLALVLIRRRPPADVVEGEPERVELAAGEGPPARPPGALIDGCGGNRRRGRRAVRAVR